MYCFKICVKEIQLAVQLTSYKFLNLIHVVRSLYSLSSYEEELENREDIYNVSMQSPFILKHIHNFERGRFFRSKTFQNNLLHFFFIIIPPLAFIAGHMPTSIDFSHFYFRLFLFNFRLFLSSYSSIQSIGFLYFL